MGKRYSITEEEMKRYEVMREVMNNVLSLRQAQEVLGLSYRQTLRIKERFRREGFEGLLRKKSTKFSALKLIPEIREQIISLRKSLYSDFNILHFKDKLREEHGIDLSYETIRKVLIQEGLHNPKKKRKIYRRRRRMPKAGMLIQMDSSVHQWVECINEPWWLIAMIDDADLKVYAEFHPSDTLWANMRVLRAYIEERGIFMALYTDKASHFVTTRHGGIHYQTEVEQKGTQIQRALSELGITLINANSPQAKGRIERRFRFFQDRLIKEMRLRGIKNYEEANRYMREEFLPWYNSRYGRIEESCYRSLTPDKDLDLIFSIKHKRKVKKDNTISFSQRIFQLVPQNGIRSFEGRWVEVCECFDEKIEILCDGKRVRYVEITNEEKEKVGHQENKSVNGTNTENEVYNLRRRKKYIPPADHPWRKLWTNVTF